VVRTSGKPAAASHTPLFCEVVGATEKLASALRSGDEAEDEGVLIPWGEWQSGQGDAKQLRIKLKTAVQQGLDGQKTCLPLGGAQSR
jgi:hypothetical protein